MKKAKYGSGFKLFDYYKTVARVGGVFSALSLAAMAGASNILDASKIDGANATHIECADIVFGTGSPPFGIPAACSETWSRSRYSA